VGLERQLRGKPAGIRTSSLICIGTSMFVYLGRQLEGDHSDPARVVGQVVTGIGFLGAGVIMTRNGLLTGVTSAAVIWILAAAGASIGLGRFGMALVVSAVSVAVLVGVEQLERAFSGLRRGVHANAQLEPHDSEDADEGIDPEPRTSGSARPRRSRFRR
jgi:putative Mg2+ transporter-C (MgtC) family protein